MNALARTLHDLTHRLPGVPAHVDAADRRSHGRADASPGLRKHGARPPHAHHHQDPPRVLVAWQNRIARLVHADDSA